MVIRLWRTVHPAYSFRILREQTLDGLLAAAATAVPAPFRQALRTLEATLNDQVGDDVVDGTVVVTAADSAVVLRAHPADVATALPLTRATAEVLYGLGEASRRGVEKVGTVLDEKLRKSREVAQLRDPSCPVVLSKALLDFDFPEARRAIQAALCPTAAEIEVRPYKIVSYAEGDFFGPHLDSMSEANMFGSLALQLPVQYSGDSPSDGTASSGGRLVFYLGREAPAEQGFDPDQVRNTASHERVQLERRDGTHDALAREVDLTRVERPHDDGSVTLRYAAWLGDVPHEVTTVTRPRVVLLYRLFKRGETSAVVSVPAPVVESIQTQLRDIFSAHLPLAISFQGSVLTNVGTEDSNDDGCFTPNATAPVTWTPTEGYSMPATANLQCVGFILRHQYPPAGLVPSGLKGVDAIAYRIASATNECHLLPATEVRRDCAAQPYRFTSLGQGTFVHRMIQTAERPASLHREHFEDVVKAFPALLAVWIQLGYGHVIGADATLGNWDCDVNWWYRSAVMIVLPRPSKWARRRWFFLALEKGDAPTIRRLHSVMDVFQHVIQFV